MARVPALERRVGSDRVARWHAMSGRYAMSLIVAHVGLTVAGYAAQAAYRFVEQTVTVVVAFPEMIKATIGTGLVLLSGSSRPGWCAAGFPTGSGTTCICSPMWRSILTFWHQLATGAEFVAT